MNYGDYSDPSWSCPKGVSKYVSSAALYSVDIESFTVSFSVVIGFALLYLLWTLHGASKSVLNQSNAIKVDASTYPRLVNIVSNLATVAGLPMPAVYIIDDPSPNAFATGIKPEKAAVAVTTGIMELMDDRELEAVLSHEISHIKNYDMRVNTVVYGLTMLMGIIVSIALRTIIYANMGSSRKNKDAGAIVIVIMLAIAIVGGIMKLFMSLITLVISRQREYLADATGAEITHNVDSLASALNKLRLNERELTKYNVAAAHLFFADPAINDTPAKIGKPGIMAKFHNLFSTHPPLELRIARLKGFGDINQGITKANSDPRLLDESGGDCCAKGM